MRTIDLNCDMGEHFGIYKIPHDENAIMARISSINVACGYHAGDPDVMYQTITKAINYNLKIGAHPGLPDLAGFGRRSMAITPQQCYDIVLYQIGALYAFIKACQGTLNHVKPHGALYTMAAQHESLANAIVEAVYDFDPELVLYGLSGSYLTDAGRKKGLNVAHEVFADRTYQENGFLTPRDNPDCMVSSIEQSCEQVLNMALNQKVITPSGQSISVHADTVCIHGDSDNALSLLDRLQTMLQDHQITIN